MASYDDGAKDGEDEEGDDADYAWEIDPTEVDLQGVIGVGSTATVYLGVLRGVTVAVKEIEAPQQEATLQAFQRELRILSQVEHPHIVKFIGLVTETLPLRICLEYCGGGSIFELLHNCWHVPVSWRQRLKVLVDTASAATHLHNFDPPIIHRDLKSLNLLLTEPVADQHVCPFVKLCDFGFARVHEELLAVGAPMTKGAGTSHWMAPEVYLGTNYSEKADIFSFAMIMYETISRHVPFEKLDPTAASRNISTGVRPDLDDASSVPRVTPPGLLELLVACWAQDPAARPTFPEIAERLTDISARTPEDLQGFAPPPEDG